MSVRQNVMKQESGQGVEQAGEGLSETDVEKIRSLIGIPDRDEIVNPEKPYEIAGQLTVTFRPPPDGYDRREVLDFRTKLREELKDCGAELVPWEEARTESNGWMSKLFGWKKISGRIDAVVDVRRKYSLLRKVFIDLSEKVYAHFLRSPERSVGEILNLTAWAEHLPKHYVRKPFNTQVITLKELDSEFVDEEAAYDQKISIGLSHLINTMSEFVIGVSGDRFALINMNMSDAVFPMEQLRPFLLTSLIPKTCASIRPPLLTRFERDTFEPEQSRYVDRLVDMGGRLESTDLFPRGTKFNDLIDRVSRRDVLDRYLEGRTGVSYGFIAYVEPPAYQGPREIRRDQWEDLDRIGDPDRDLLRENESGRWYVQMENGDTVQYRQLPDVRVMTSRSGCNKTDLDPERDVVRIGLRSGTLQFHSPEGVELKRKDVRPSFDTYVIVANALASALYFPHLVEDGAPMLHFHGYPDPTWFQNGEAYTGASNLSVSCGTVEAALLNYSGIHELARSGQEELNLLCIVEPDHGVNILGKDVEYVVERVKEGCEDGKIQLGGKFLRELS